MIPYSLTDANKVLVDQYSLNLEKKANCKLVEKSRLINYINKIPLFPQLDHHKIRTGEISKKEFKKRFEKLTQKILQKQEEGLAYLKQELNVSIPQKAIKQLENEQKSFLFNEFKKQVFIQKKEISKQARGKTRDWIFNIRSFLLDLENAELVFESFWSIYKKKYPFQVTGETLAGALTAQLLSLKAKAKGFDVNCFLVREERKITGLQKKVEGIIKEKTPVVIIDDLFNTGATISYLMTILKIGGNQYKSVQISVPKKSLQSRLI